MRPDPLTLLRELRPSDPPPPPDEAVLERIVGSPGGSPPPRRLRRRILRPALAAATAAVAVALAVAPGGSPDVLARAAQALGDEDAILHFRTESRLRSHGAELSTRAPDDTVDARSETWQADGGRRERYLSDGSEFVRDWDARLSIGYNAERDELIRHTHPDVFAADAQPRGIDSATFFGGSFIGDLARAFERARSGDGSIDLLGETTVRGIDVYELEIEYTEDTFMLPEGQTHTDADDLQSMKVRSRRTIYVDRERFLPVRVVERSEWPARGGEVIHSITDYLDVERLPRTPENEEQLEMSPHPGAKEIREDRV